jgi:AAA15 family ATPase/GTPase
MFQKITVANFRGFRELRLERMKDSQVGVVTLDEGGLHLALEQHWELR